jgi:mannonate dehydratase
VTDQMRVSIGQYFELVPSNLRYVRQLGVAGVDLVLPRTPDDRLSYEDFVGFRQVCEEHDLRLEAIEQIPVPKYEKIMLGQDGRDEQIDNYRRIVRDIGRAGIPILGLHWMPNFVWRTHNVVLRGGAATSAFDLDKASTDLTHGREYGPEEMWRNFAYFMEAVLPVAEEAGVRIALHPDDPPVDSLGGIARVFKSFADFDRATTRFPTHAFSLMFCMGTWSEMGPGVVDAIRHFAGQDRIAFVHFRDVQGHVPSFHECFLGDGNVPVTQALTALLDAGFTGFLIDDHVPRLEGDAEQWNHRGRALETGKLQGLLRAVKDLHGAAPAQVP